MIKSSAHDGIANSFRKGESGFKKSSNQFDDEVVARGSTPEAQMDNFVNHEIIKSKDILFSMEHTSLT